MQIRSDLRQDLPTPGYTNGTLVRFYFQSSQGKSGFIWTDNGIIRIEPGFANGNRFRLYDKSVDQFSERLKTCSGHPVKTTLGKVSFGRDAKRRRMLSWVNATDPNFSGAISFTDKDYEGFVAAYEACRSWVKAAHASAKELPAARKLVVLAAHTLIQEGLISTRYPETDARSADGVIEHRFPLYPGAYYEVRARAYDVGHGELRIDAALDLNAPGGRQRKGDMMYAGACLERKTGLFLQGDGDHDTTMGILGKTAAALVDRKVVLPENPVFRFQGPIMW